MERMGLKLTPVVVRCLLGPLGMFGPMAGTSWTHSYSPNKRYNPPLATHPLICTTCDTVAMKKVAQI